MAAERGVKEERRNRVGERYGVYEDLADGEVVLLEAAVWKEIRFGVFRLSVPGPIYLTNHRLIWLPDIWEPASKRSTIWLSEVVEVAVGSSLLWRLQRLSGWNHWHVATANEKHEYAFGRG